MKLHVIIGIEDIMFAIVLIFRGYCHAREEVAKGIAGIAAERV